MTRYAIPNEHALGVPVGKIQALARSVKKATTPDQRHDLATRLWRSGVYEGRMFACFVDDPALVTSAQMDQWIRDFDSWAICDTACFHLFDRLKPAVIFRKSRRYAKLKPEFQRRTAFALLASLALHLKPKDLHESEFLDALGWIRAAAKDDRNFVKKGVSWALRGIGRRTPVLRTAAMKIAASLAASDNAAERWIGKDVLRDLNR